MTEIDRLKYGTLMDPGHTLEPGAGGLLSNPGSTEINNSCIGPKTGLPGDALHVLDTAPCKQQQLGQQELARPRKSQQTYGHRSYAPGPDATGLDCKARFPWEDRKPKSHNAFLACHSTPSAYSNARWLWLRPVLPLSLATPACGSISVPFELALRTLRPRQFEHGAEGLQTLGCGQIICDGFFTGVIGLIPPPRLDGRAQHERHVAKELYILNRLLYVDLSWTENK
ncbi:hypothetical protein EYF80_054321 [Liparis tanakae]|uniref:Uncharacterized protein n=1 Tax=Liparis tanakae TaxID=230148 RepID=A0A4Z2F496_9TELE|nr:hypothetical protein EYF80_054321 [Liparis tanakae]